ncbi:thiamine biosynthesis protein ThiS [Neokomagataea thailandica NBRC 106555]|uniref:Sulfur carrier protein ThiS n=2 Tax=Neokomagataea TaxID=1223423 RepID=A0A4Y6V5H6_9PROT|nr:MULTISPECIES: sulfur carrier protein ThiS [Neokomagataea]QDH23930.1 sulfur carrier protein ThiS [Neokomagataea tanensis]GBR54491.1 thiamine biosynthesis protein ThiS [Neokomagataea thailandica NBRC 106555]
MRITVNDEPHDVAATTLASVLEELGYGDSRVATALNGTFIPASQRDNVTLSEGAALEVLAPMQGG